MNKKSVRYPLPFSPPDLTEGLFVEVNFSKKLPNLNISKYSTYKHFHNILRLLDDLPNFPFTTSETIRYYYL